MAYSEGFLNVQADEYWSNSSYCEEIAGWTMNFSSDQTRLWQNWGTATKYYWAVRAGQADIADSNYPVNIRKTGNTISFTTGDDGDQQWGVAWPSPRFVDTDSNPGTKTDMFSGLMWMTSGNPILNLGAGGEIYSFEDAMDFIEAINTDNKICRVAPSLRKQCFPFTGFSIPQTLCPADYVCQGFDYHTSQWGECYGPSIIVMMTVFVIPWRMKNVFSFRITVTQTGICQT